MGNDYSMQVFEQRFIWKHISNRLQGNEGNIAEDQISKLQANYFQMPLYDDYSYQLELLSRHKNTSHKNVVRLLYAQVTEKAFLDCSNADVLTVYTEIISSRLNQIYCNQIEYLTIIKQVSEASAILIDLGKGYFRMSEKMIGFTPQRVTKVWLNEHFGKHQIDPTRLLRNEEDMVKSILSIFVYKLINTYDFFYESSLKGLIQAVDRVINNSIMPAQRLGVSISVLDTNSLNNKVRLTKVKRTSIESKVTPIEIRPKLLKPYQKLGQQNKKVLRQSQISYKQPEKPLKYSLANSQIFHPTIQEKPVFKKSVRINYNNAPLATNNRFTNLQQSCDIDHSLTQFPKEQLQIATTVNPAIINKKSSLRTNYKKFSSITERSQEDSEYSQATNSKSLIHYNDGVMKRSQFFNSFAYNQ